VPPAVLPSMAGAHGPWPPGWECPAPKPCRTPSTNRLNPCCAMAENRRAVRDGTRWPITLRDLPIAKARAGGADERNFGFRARGLQRAGGQGRTPSQGCDSKPPPAYCAMDECTSTWRLTPLLRRQLAAGEALPQLLDQLGVAAGAGAGPHGGHRHWHSTSPIWRP